MAESRQHKIIDQLIESLKHMFSAIFFVAIGLLLDPKVLLTYALPITIITIAVVIGKVLTCSLGAFASGRDGRTSMRVGMGLAQIGEFSFIIASLGVTLHVMSDFLYPIIVAVSALTTFLTPYLIKNADPFAAQIAKLIPKRLTQVFNVYTLWLQNIQMQSDQAVLMRIVRRSILQIFINLFLISAIFFFGAYLAHAFGDKLMAIMQISKTQILKTIIWGSALVISLPFLIAVYRKIKALSMILAELSIKPNKAGQLNLHLRRLISEVIPAVSMIGVMLIISALSSSILPPVELLFVVFIIVALLTLILWRWLVAVHAKLQVTFIERLHP
jgi:CPA2 family monovalent cation:H+ antiporter-2